MVLSIRGQEVSVFPSFGSPDTSDLQVSDSRIKIIEPLYWHYIDSEVGSPSNSAGLRELISEV